MSISSLDDSCDSHQNVLVITQDFSISEDVCPRGAASL